ncbi:ARL14 effector protein [Nymphon striatum]|nr:ARL14 effector protein [Nymphon striatum]
MEELEACSIGLAHNDQCHKTSYSKMTGLISGSDLGEEDLKIIAWRSGLRGGNVSVSTICLHHKYLYSNTVYWTKYGKCCDPLDTHTRKVKEFISGICKIGLAFAEELENIGINIVPGQKLCPSCLKKVKNDVAAAAGSESSTSTDESTPGTCKEVIKHKLNQSLELTGVSPVKTHGLKKHARMEQAKTKISKVVGNLQESFSSVIGVDMATLQAEPEAEICSSDIIKKANDLDQITTAMKSKLATADHSTQIQILTLTPESWSRRYAANYFEMSESTVRLAMELKKSKGILGTSVRKPRTGLSDVTVQMVQALYENDEYSRLMPGKKDFVSIGRNVHQQKRLLLCNLKELHAAFMEKHPDHKLGFSKFCTLRPKWCVSVGASGTHSVCVCTHHQNTILLVHAAGIDQSYKDLMKMVVCDVSSRMCMVHRCKDCPGTTNLEEFLNNHFKDYTDDDQILYQQWQSTDRSNLYTISSTIAEYVCCLTKAIDNLTSHSFIAKCQSQYLSQEKDNLGSDSCIALFDFAENYQYTVQDEVQSFHWNKSQCTIHPVVIYFKEEGKLNHQSLCCISDDLEHDTGFVHALQSQVVSYLAKEHLSIKHIHYFSDGCAAQYKNYKNILNLCYHHEDFNVRASWSFFASSHGKSPCDGVGGVVKRLLSRASLQRATDNQILTVEAVLDFCINKIYGIHFIFLSKEILGNIRTTLGKRFLLGHTIPGTRSFHHFEPLSSNSVGYKRTSQDPSYTGIYTFQTQLSSVLHSSASPMDYVVCRYDDNWWIGIVQERNQEENDVLIYFMHPHGPSTRFQWPTREDICWVPTHDVLCKSKIDAPTTETGRNYIIANSVCESIQTNFENHIANCC